MELLCVSSSPEGQDPWAPLEPTHLCSSAALCSAGEEMHRAPLFPAAASLLHWALGSSAVFPSSSFCILFLTFSLLHLSHKGYSLHPQFSQKTSHHPWRDRSGCLDPSSSWLRSCPLS